MHGNLGVFKSPTSENTHPTPQLPQNGSYLERALTRTISGAYKSKPHIPALRFAHTWWIENYNCLSHRKSSSIASSETRGQLSRQIEHKGTGAFTPAHSFHSPAPTPFPVSVQPHFPWLRSQATSQRNAGHKHKRGASCGDTHHVNGGTKRVGNIPE